MGSFDEFPGEPELAAAGRVFRAIPAFGVLTEGDDTLNGGALRDGIVGAGGGNDLIALDYSSLANAVNANAFLGSVFVPFTNFDTLSFFDFERFKITGGAGDDTLVGGGSGATTLLGGLGDDNLTMSGGGNRVSAGDGNDIIIGATLADTVLGGAGVDVLYVDLSGAAGPVDLRVGKTFGNWSGIEQFADTLTPFDDRVHGGALALDIDGGLGHDRIVLDYRGLAGDLSQARIAFYGANDGGSVQLLDAEGALLTAVFLWQFEQVTIIGSVRDDFMVGASRSDHLTGGGGDDTLTGGGGADTLRGGAGNDYLSGSQDAAGQILGGAGNDTLNAYRVDDTIGGGSGLDLLQLDLWGLGSGVVVDLIAKMPGWRGIEAVNGRLTEHDDTFRSLYLTGNIDGGAGEDTVVLDYSASGVGGMIYAQGRLEVAFAGAVDSDIFFLSSFERLDLTGSTGFDRLTGDMMDDTLSGDIGNDTLDGGHGDDILHGDTGDDLVFGGAGADMLSGGANNDTLSGGGGDDVLIGGAGRDTFHFRAFDSGIDVIRDIRARADTILLEAWTGPAVLAQDGTDVVIATNEGSIRVQNTTESDVAAAIVLDALWPMM